VSPPLPGAGAPPFERVLVANRGEIACRVLATLARLGVGSVAVHSEADAGALHVRRADVACPIGPPPVAESYLRGDRILAAARETGAGAIHPGYGLLSENAAFAEACEAAGVVFLGPTPRQIDDFGRKDRARELARAAGVPICPGSDVLGSAEEARRAAREIGFPLLLKATAGGGGIGMELCRDDAELDAAFAGVARQAESHFGSAEVFLERFVERARHVEVQIFGDGAGGVLTLGERDCSLQRRRQKVVEESPAPDLPDALRDALARAAHALAASVGYRSAGTVEFLVEPEREHFHFLEVNTRLQVEHGVTEARHGVDLVEWMVRLGAGEPLPATVPAPRGHAVEARLYAEDPARGFRPSAGRLSEVRFPDDVRVDTGVDAGSDVPPFYDPMLAKLVAWGASRDEALARMADALDATRLGGVATNLPYLREVLRWPDFLEARHDTRSLEGFAFAPRTFSVERPGVATTVQDWPGRLGLWGVGVPPAGAMDGLALRLANRIVGNPEGAAGLEIAVAGPALRFDHDAVVAVAGAPVEADLDGEAFPAGRAVPIRAGQTLSLGRVGAGDAAGPAGVRACLAIRGAIEVPETLGSRATFTLAGFGGHAGRALVAGDVLPFADPSTEAALEPPLAAVEAADLAALHPLASPDAPIEGGHWELRVLDGPHGEGFFTDDDLRDFYGEPFEVHFQSARTGVRLVGPRPRFARPDGGEAGLHPSNIHDTAYAVGAVDYTGDMPVVLGPDGPSLGGFVCPAVVIHADRWKLGQLRAGDAVRFRAVSDAEALEADRIQARCLATRTPERKRLAPSPLRGPRDDGVLFQRAARDDAPELRVRRSGDRYVLVELGPLVLDVELRMRVQLLHDALEARVAAGDLEGVIDLTPGVRSLQVHFDPERLPRERVLEAIDAAERDLPAGDALAVPSRMVHLPLSWDDPAAARAVAKYGEVVRDDAPWLPSNIEFIRRINGLDSQEDVRRILFDARYLVLGLGDVYLGAPVATPLDPRHRLVTTKYNPARTWTPENAVGIGGAYLCVYGMEGPGGYQLVGRTIPVWSTHERWRGAAAGRPWLLRCFDRIRFFPVSAEELLERRRAIEHGTGTVEIEDGVLEAAAYRDFLAGIADDVERFRTRQRRAFDAERERWVASGELEAAARAGRAAEARPAADAEDLGEGVAWVTAPLGAQVLHVHVAAGDRVAAGDALAVLSAMKTETTVHADADGTVERVACAPGSVVVPGAPLVALRSAS